MNKRSKVINLFGDKNIAKNEEQMICGIFIK